MKYWGCVSGTVSHAPMAHQMTHENVGCFRERRRLAGFAFRINAAAIPNPGRRDAGAPRVFSKQGFSQTLNCGIPHESAIDCVH
jgi:hypothetical protein